MKAVVLITSGTGPTEVREFVSLLARELEQRWRKAGVRVEKTLPATASTASICLRVEAESLDWLAREEGTHALVARFPTRARHSRKRWYAAVKLLCEAPAGDAPQPGKLLVTACRSGGPGGQNVNKRSTAVRAVDPVSGLAVRVDEQRLQSSNRRIAEGRIRQTLQERFDAERAEHRSALRMQHYRVVRGSPVRTWRINGAGALEEVM